MTFYYDKTSATFTPLLIAVNELVNNGTTVVKKTFNIKKDFLT